MKSICNEPTTNYDYDDDDDDCDRDVDGDASLTGLRIEMKFLVGHLNELSTTHEHNGAYRHTNTRIPMHVCVYVRHTHRERKQRCWLLVDATLASAAQAAEQPTLVNSCFVEKQAEHHYEVAVVKLYGALSCLKNNNTVRSEYAPKHKNEGSSMSLGRISK